MPLATASWTVGGSSNQIPWWICKIWPGSFQRNPAAAPGILWLWDKGPSLESKNVNGVLNQENASWDLAFTSLK